jgi:membrane fusion protein, multidrug efflux system
MKLNKPTVFLFGSVLTLAVVIGLVTFFKFQAMQGGGWGGGGPVPVSMLSIQTRSLDNIFEAQGSIQTDNQVDLKPEITGIVKQILFQEGDTVQKGDVLIRLEADKQTAQVLQSQANSASDAATIQMKQASLAQAQAELTATQSRLNLAETEFRRFETLHKQQFVSDLELAQKHTAYDSAQADVAVAHKRLNSAKSEVSQARQNTAASGQVVHYNQALANDTVIRSPFTGKIGLKYVALGDTVAPGQKLLSVVQTENLKVAFNVPERYINGVRMGAPIHFYLESNPSQELLAKTIFISPSVDSETRTLSVKGLIQANLTHSKFMPRPGQFAKVRLVLGTNPSAVVVPEDVLIPQGEKFFVYVVSSDPKTKKPISSLKEVMTGQRQSGEVEIVKGLNTGDVIVTTGLQKLSEGQEIMDISKMPMPPNSPQSGGK